MLQFAYLEFQDYREKVSGFSENGMNKQSSMLSSAQSVLTKGIGGITAKPSTGVKTIKIQFAPASLSFQMGASKRVQTRGDVSKPISEKEKSIEIKNPAQSAQGTLSFQLFFETYFGIINDVTARAEGFLAAAGNPYTRQVSFNWGELYYKGRITSVDVTYQMFDQFGTPMRAQLNVTMSLDNTSVVEER